LQKNHKISKNQ